MVSFCSLVESLLSLFWAGINFLVASFGNFTMTLCVRKCVRNVCYRFLYRCYSSGCSFSFQGVDLFIKTVQVKIGTLILTLVMQKNSSQHRHTPLFSEYFIWGSKIQETCIFSQYLIPKVFFSFAGLQILHGNLLLCSADYCVRGLLCFKVILAFYVRRLLSAYKSIVLYIPIVIHVVVSTIMLELVVCATDKGIRGKALITLGVPVQGAKSCRST